MVISLQESEETLTAGCHYKDLGLLQRKKLSQYMPFYGNMYLLPQNAVRWQALQLHVW
jgi:hypothetical protein